MSTMVEPGAAAEADFWQPPPKRAPALLLIALVLAGAVAAIFYAWQIWPFGGSVEQTDNAYVRGRTTVISPQVSGYVVDVPAQDFQSVRAGQVLVRIEEPIFRAKVDQARAATLSQIANLDQSVQAERASQAGVQAQEAAVARAEALLWRARADLRRADALSSDDSISAREVDQFRATLRQAEAELGQAQAARAIAREDVRKVVIGRAGLAASVKAADASLDLARIDLEHSIVRAPENGQLSEVAVRRGQYVTAGTQLMFLVPKQRWVVANFKESQTRDIRVGQRARFAVDALGGEWLDGRVESLAPAAGSEFAVLKADNATGNFVKVAQRIAVRISVDPGQPLADRLRPGMSVVARVQTGR